MAATPLPSGGAPVSSEPHRGPAPPAHTPHAPQPAHPFTSPLASEIPVSIAIPDDIRAGLVVSLVALPLCLGVALASGAPLTSGIIAGIVGGLVVALISGSQLMVSGPAAGLTAIVFAAITELGSFPAFLAALVVAGLFQAVLAALRAGIIGYYFPSSVIKGMLASIGIILVLKQLPHAVGYDSDAVGDETFRQLDHENTFSAIATALGRMHPTAVTIAVVCLGILLAWPKLPWKRLRAVPPALVVVLAGVGLNALAANYGGDFALETRHLVQLPASMLSGIVFPDWAALANGATWKVAVTIAIVASLETLLSLEATDKMDPYKREAPTNRELLAQGVGNTLSGLVGGLPVTGVIVRSAANIDAGAKTRWAAVLHGIFLLAAVVAIPSLLNRIPLAALAAILIATGWKLAHPKQLRDAWRLGRYQFVPFVVTILAILLTDLLIGITVGMTIGVFFILRDHMRLPALKEVSPPHAVLRRFALSGQVTFLNKASIIETLESLPADSRVEIDARESGHLDFDVIEALHNFAETARLRNIDYRMVGIPALAHASSGTH